MEVHGIGAEVKYWIISTHTAFAPSLPHLSTSEQVWLHVQRIKHECSAGTLSTGGDHHLF